MNNSGLTITPEIPANHGIFGQFKEFDNNDKNTIHLPRQGERTTECVVKSRAELGIVRQS